MGNDITAKAESWAGSDITGWGQIQHKSSVVRLRNCVRPYRRNHLALWDRGGEEVQMKRKEKGGEREERERDENWIGESKMASPRCREEAAGMG